MPPIFYPIALLGSAENEGTGVAVGAFETFGALVAPDLFLLLLLY